MLTRTGRALMGGGMTFCLAGLFFGNWPVFGAGTLLVLLTTFSTLAREPRVVVGVDRTRIERGGKFTVTMTVELPRGLGVAEVHQPLPEEFELVSGNNFHVLTFGLRKRVETHVFQVHAPKRGEYVLPGVGVKVIHPLGFTRTPSLRQGAPLTLRVEPRPIPARLPRDLRTRAKRPYPDGDLARMGVATNEFRELREYRPGDPPRRINWKATARRIGSGASEVPLVNDPEWEGKKTVWILVDGHARMSVGTNLEDVREHAADAALSLMELYLRRGYQVGMAMARSGAVPAIRPGTGESQVRRARELLSRLEPRDAPSLLEVLDQNVATLVRGRPLVVLVTRLAGSDEDLAAALRRLGAMGRRNGRNIVPGLVIDVEPAPPEHASSVTRLARLALENARVEMRAAASAAGLKVTEWRAGREPLEAVLVRRRIA